MADLADMIQLRHTLQRDRERLELLLQLLVVESKLTPPPRDVQLFDPVIRHMQERLEQVTGDLKLYEAELGKR